MPATPELDDTEKAALIAELKQTIATDPFPRSPRVRTLRAIPSPNWNHRRHAHRRYPAAKHGLGIDARDGRHDPARTGKGGVAACVLTAVGALEGSDDHVGVHEVAHQHYQ
jgi:hypothetical protein